MTHFAVAEKVDYIVAGPTDKLTHRPCERWHTGAHQGSDRSHGSLPHIFKGSVEVRSWRARRSHP
eukprot:2685027-Alexandrium_andersonii.AAC.1